MLTVFDIILMVAVPVAGCAYHGVTDLVKRYFTAGLRHDKAGHTESIVQIIIDVVLCTAYTLAAWQKSDTRRALAKTSLGHALIALGTVATVVMLMVTACNVTSELMPKESTSSAWAKSALKIIGLPGPRAVLHVLYPVQAAATLLAVLQWGGSTPPVTAPDVSTPPAPSTAPEAEGAATVRAPHVPAPLTVPAEAAATIRTPPPRFSDAPALPPTQKMTVTRRPGTTVHVTGQQVIYTERCGDIVYTGSGAAPSTAEERLEDMRAITEGRKLLSR